MKILYKDISALIYILSNYKLFFDFIYYLYSQNSYLDDNTHYKKQ